MTLRITRDLDAINAMSPSDIKVWENRLRRMAHRQGLRLIKSRRRDPRAIDYGTYLLVDQLTNTVVQGPYFGGFADLTDIEHCLIDEGPDT